VFAVNGPAIEILKDELFLLGDAEQIDDRLSWYPADCYGQYVFYNSYLLRGGRECLLVESGVVPHHPTIRRQLNGLLAERDSLNRIAVTRNEPECVCNIPNLVNDFGVGSVHSLPLMSSLQFLRGGDLRAASFDARAAELQLLEFGVQCIPAEGSKDIPIGGKARLEVFETPLRVLPTNWFYDRQTRTLFCSDTFCGETSETRDIRTSTDVVSECEMTARLSRDLTRKFDWLVRSDLSGIIGDLERYFGERQIDILAPTRGNVIVGRRAVELRLRALIQVLKNLNAAHSGKPDATASLEQ
jgi:flavorubredoxin